MNLDHARLSGYHWLLKKRGSESVTAYATVQTWEARGRLWTYAYKTVSWEKQRISTHLFWFKTIVVGWYQIKSCSHHLLYSLPSISFKALRAKERERLSQGKLCTCGTPNNLSRLMLRINFQDKRHALKTMVSSEFRWEDFCSCFPFFRWSGIRSSGWELKGVLPCQIRKRRCVKMWEQRSWRGNSQRAVLKSWWVEKQ